MSKRDALLSESDKDLLFEMAALCKGLPGVLVEVGSFYGASAALILKGSSGSGKTLFCFDLFPPEMLESFNTYMSELGFAARVRTATGDFRNTLPLLQHPEIAFAFVDHNHTFGNTAFAWNTIWPKLSPGGLLAFHDYGHADYPGGTQFLDSVGVPFKVQGGMAVFQKQRK